MADEEGEVPASEGDNGGGSSAPPSRDRSQRQGATASSVLRRLPKPRVSIPRPRPVGEVGTQAFEVASGQEEGTFAFMIGMLMTAFVVFITAKGELPTYLAFFIPGPAAAPANTTTTAGVGGATTTGGVTTPAPGTPTGSTGIAPGAVGTGVAPGSIAPGIIGVPTTGG